MKPLQRLIIRTVDTDYPSNASFYKKHMNSGRWYDFKTGKTNIDKMAFDRVKAMTKELFTYQELDLLDQAEDSVLESNGELDTDLVLEKYDALKQQAGL